MGQQDRTKEGLSLVVVRERTIQMDSGKDS